MTFPSSKFHLVEKERTPCSLLNSLPWSQTAAPAPLQQEENTPILEVLLLQTSHLWIKLMASANKKGNWTGIWITGTPFCYFPAASISESKNF